MSRISVVIPVYNGERYIKEAIESLQRQTRKPDEVIVVDDGSTDGTAELVKKYDWVTYHHQNNLGPSIARNEGIRMALGDYIAVHDADDRSSPSRLQKQAKVLDEFPEIGVVYSDVVTINENGIVLNTLRSEGLYPDPADFLAALLDRQIIPCLPAIMARKTCFLTVPYPENLVHAEDYQLTIEMAKLFRFHYIPEVLYEYRRHAHNLTNQHQKQLLAEQNIILQLGTESIRSIVEQSSLPLEEKKLLTATIHMKVRQYLEALGVLSEVKEGLRSSVFYFMRGVCGYQLEMFQNAKEDFMKALEVDPNMAEAHNNLGCTWIRLDSREESLFSFETAIRLKPGYMDAETNRDSFHHNTRADDPAWKLTNKLLRKVLTPYR
jgi:glycosyltransferase involved in cell wall biosynthesis